MLLLVVLYFLYVLRELIPEMEGRVKKNCCSFYLCLLQEE